MADLTLAPDTTGDTDGGPDRESTTSTRPNTPRWVKVSGIIALVLILMLVIMMLTGGGPGGGHGPGRHAPPSSVIEQGVSQQ